MTQRMQKLLKETGGCCIWCGQPLDEKDATVDHIVPASKGGSSKLDNLAAAHRTCNARKADSMPAAFIASLPKAERRALMTRLKSLKKSGAVSEAKYAALTGSAKPKRSQKTTAKTPAAVKETKHAFEAMPEIDIMSGIDMIPDIDMMPDIDIIPDIVAKYAAMTGSVKGPAAVKESKPAVKPPVVTVRTDNGTVTVTVTVSISLRTE